MVRKTQFKTLGKKSLLEDAVDGIQKGILEGNYQAGSFLPSEGEFVKQLGVSRTIIREAMRVLESRGLVEVSQGRRPRVGSGDPEAVSSALDVLKGFSIEAS